MEAGSHEVSTFLRSTELNLLYRSLYSVRVPFPITHLIASPGHPEHFAFFAAQTAPFPLQSVLGTIQLPDPLDQGTPLDLSAVCPNPRFSQCRRTLWMPRRVTPYVRDEHFVAVTRDNVLGLVTLPIAGKDDELTTSRADSVSWTPVRTNISDAMPSRYSSGQHVWTISRDDERNEELNLVDLLADQTVRSWALPQQRRTWMLVGESTEKHCRLSCIEDGEVLVADMSMGLVAERGVGFGAPLSNCSTLDPNNVVAQSRCGTFAFAATWDGCRCLDWRDLDTCRSIGPTGSRCDLVKILPDAATGEASDTEYSFLTAAESQIALWNCREELQFVHSAHDGQILTVATCDIKQHIQRDTSAQEDVNEPSSDSVTEYDRRRRKFISTSIDSTLHVWEPST